MNGRPASTQPVHCPPSTASWERWPRLAAGGISGVLLAWGAYQGGASAQSSNAVLAIKAMYLYIPMLLLICSIVTMLFYNLDKIYPQIKAVLDSRNE
ncbi:MAG: MFS transporter [Enterocloster sp.]